MTNGDTSVHVEDTTETNLTDTADKTDDTAKTDKTDDATKIDKTEDATKTSEIHMKEKVVEKKAGNIFEKLAEDENAGKAVDNSEASKQKEIEAVEEMVADSKETKQVAKTAETDQDNIKKEEDDTNIVTEDTEEMDTEATEDKGQWVLFLNFGCLKIISA